MFVSFGRLLWEEVQNPGTILCDQIKRKAFHIVSILFELFLSREAQNPETILVKQKESISSRSGVCYRRKLKIQGPFYATIQDDKQSISCPSRSGFSYRRKSNQTKQELIHNRVHIVRASAIVGSPESRDHLIE